MQFYIQQYADVMTALDAIPEGTGTMLDNTLVLLASELSDSDGHGTNKLGFIAGGNTGMMRSGFHFDGGPDRNLYTSSDYDTSQFLVSLANAFCIRDAGGQEIEQFGIEGWSTGNIPGLFA